MKKMIFELNYPPYSWQTATVKERVNLEALRKVFGIAPYEAMEACKRAAKAVPVDKVKVVCTAEQFGLYIAERCAAGGQNLVQALHAHELPEKTVEPGIGPHGTVFNCTHPSCPVIERFYNPGEAITAEAIKAGHATETQAPNLYQQCVDRIFRKPKTFIRTLDFADVEQRVMASLAAKTDRMEKAAAGEDASKRQFGCVPELGMGYNTGPTKWGDYDLWYAAKGYGMSAVKFGTAMHKEIEVKGLEARAKGCREKAKYLYHLMSKCSPSSFTAQKYKRRADDLYAQARTLEEKARIANKYGVRKPWEYSYGALVAFQKDAVSRGDLEWEHVKAVKGTFGVEHTHQLHPDQYRTVYDALRAVIAARKFGAKKYRETLDTLAKLTSENALLRNNLGEAACQREEFRERLNFDTVSKTLYAASQHQLQVRSSLLAQACKERDEAQSQLGRVRSYEGLYEKALDAVRGLQNELQEEKVNRAAVVYAVKTRTRDEIVAHMEQQANDLYRQAQDSSPSDAKRLRAACYSLRGHAAHIKNGQF